MRVKMVLIIIKFFVLLLFKLYNYATLSGRDICYIICIIVCRTRSNNEGETIMKAKQ